MQEVVEWSTKRISGEACDLVADGSTNNSHRGADCGGAYVADCFCRAVADNTCITVIYHHRTLYDTM